MGVGRNLSYFKDLFLKQKRLHNQVRIMGGDDDLFINASIDRGNITICTEPEAHAISEPKQTFKEWYIQKTEALVGRKALPLWRSTSFKLAGPVSFCRLVSAGCLTNSCTNYAWTGRLDKCLVFNRFGRFCYQAYCNNSYLCIRVPKTQRRPAVVFISVFRFLTGLLSPHLYCSGYAGPSDRLVIKLSP